VIRSWLTSVTRVSFGGSSFSFPFLHAAVTRPILGADFLAAHGLLVDPANKRVLVAETLLPLGRSGGRGGMVAALTDADPSVRRLLSSFPRIQHLDLRSHLPLHGVEHTIEVMGRPVFSKARRLDPVKLKIAEAEFRSLEAAGIVRRSKSPWAAPLHMVPKPDGSWRPCGDYRRLNLLTVHDRYPLPNILDFSANLSGCTVFSTIDLVKGYHQVPMAAADVEKTAIITPFGLFEYIKMPFGLRNSAQTFQRLMDHLFRLLGFAFTYIDDILVASRSAAEHQLHLRQIFTVLSDNGMVLNPAKCCFAQSSVKFLGHQVSASGVVPLARHVSAVQDFPQPGDVKALQRFLGLINFYRRFLPGVARTLKPLTDALVGSPKLLVWSDNLDKAFVAAKLALVNAVPLSHPDPALFLSLAVDASADHMGAVLQQGPDSALQPLAFFSRKLSVAQQKYSTFDRELLAAFSAVRHFRFLLEGRPFRLLTDHRPLTSALSRISPPWTALQQRHLSYLAEFTSDIVFVPGVDNVVADALSRPVVVVVPAVNPVRAVVSLSGAVSRPAGIQSTNVCSGTGPGSSTPSHGAGPELASEDMVCAAACIDYTALAAVQAGCPAVQSLLSRSSLSVQSVPVGGVSLLCDVSTGSPRPLVPPAFQRTVFDLLHDAAHPGMRATRRLISSRFVWAGLARDVNLWSRECVACQRAKVQRHVRLRPAVIPVPSRRFSHIHVDLVGPLPPSRGYTHLFTIIDRTSRWPEAVLLSSTTAAACADALFHGWVARFGVPAVITSDRGAQFTSALWAALCSLLNIHHVPTTSFHPEGNGLVERLHRRMKDALRARAAHADWAAHLPWVMLSLRAAPREDDGRSPAESLYGSQLVLPGQFLDGVEPPLEPFLRSLEAATDSFVPAPARHNIPVDSKPKVISDDLMAARFVFVRRDGHRPPLTAAYDGPYRVLRRATHVFELQLGSRVDSVSVHRLKPANVPIDVVPACPPARGRPRVRTGSRAPIDVPLEYVDLDVPGCLPPVAEAPATTPERPRAGRTRVVFSEILSFIPPTVSVSGRPVRAVRRPARYGV